MQEYQLSDFLILMSLSFIIWNRNSLSYVMVFSRGHIKSGMRSW